MYREDLDQLVALFQKGCAKVTISDDKNRYESLDEMKQHVGAKVKNLDIMGEDPGVHFLLNRSGVVYTGITPTLTIFNELRTEQITDPADAFFFKVRHFLAAYERPYVRVPFAVLAGLAFFAFIVFQVSFYIRKQHGLEIRNWTPECVVSFILGFVLVFPALYIVNSISLETKRNSQSFLAANRKEIVLMILGGMFGSFFTILAQWVGKHLFR
jgi:hypothetical protein